MNCLPSNSFHYLAKFRLASAAAELRSLGILIRVKADNIQAPGAAEKKSSLKLAFCICHHSYFIKPRSYGKSEQHACSFTKLTMQPS